MSDYLIVIGRQAEQARRLQIENFMSPGGNVIASCHIAENTYALRTRNSHPEIFNSIVAMLGSEAVVVVAPLNGEWSGQNCRPALSCFRGPDDD